MPPGLEHAFATEFLQVEVSTPRPPAFTGGAAIMVRLARPRNRPVQAWCEAFQPFHKKIPIFARAQLRHRVPCWLSLGSEL